MLQNLRSKPYKKTCSTKNRIERTNYIVDAQAEKSRQVLENFIQLRYSNVSFEYCLRSGRFYVLHGNMQIENITDIVINNNGIRQLCIL